MLCSTGLVIVTFIGETTHTLHSFIPDLAVVTVLLAITPSLFMVSTAAMVTVYSVNGVRPLNTCSLPGTSTVAACCVPPPVMVSLYDWTDPGVTGLQVN